MAPKRTFRMVVTAVILALAAAWTVAAAPNGADYANKQYVATAQWLQDHLKDPKVVVVDVRTDKYFDGKVIPGAVRMPWSLFRYDDMAENIGGAFIGPQGAQEVLGNHGITRDMDVVLYDSLKRDGGATSSYVFWVLDMLGHRKMRVLDGGLEAWTRAGGELADNPAKPKVVVYQAPPSEMNLKRWREGEFIYPRLGDPYYQILDVRSQAEYLGEAPDAGLDGRVLKLGHIPGAFNVDYRQNWRDEKTKLLKSPGELMRLYAGLDPAKAVVTYCHSGRRSAYSYYVLRVMGFEGAICYGRSWMEWGNKDKYFPVETKAHKLSGALPMVSGKDTAKAVVQGSGAQRDLEQPTSKSGYVSCGG